MNATQIFSAVKNAATKLVYSELAKAAQGRKSAPISELRAMFPALTDEQFYTAMNSEMGAPIENFFVYPATPCEAEEQGAAEEVEVASLVGVIKGYSGAVVSNYTIAGVSGTFNKWKGRRLRGMDEQHNRENAGKVAVAKARLFQLQPQHPALQW